MRTSIGLVFSALFVSAVLGATIVPNVPVKLVPGQSYVYTYTGRLVSGISKMNNNAAGLEIISDIVLQPEQDGNQVLMQMTNIRVGKHNGVINDNLNGDIVFDHQEHKQYEEELGKPIRFFWTNGQIKSFAAEQNEEEWSINIKKNILGLFNVNLNPQVIRVNRKDNSIHRPANERLVYYPIYEDGIGGICETVYQVNQAVDEWQQVETNENVFNVTKTRNYQNCLTHPTIENTNFDVRGARVACRQGKSYPVVEGYYPVPEVETTFGGCVSETPEDRFNFVKYNISKVDGFGQIDSIYGEGKTIYNTNGNQIVVIVKQNLTLENVLPTSRVGKIQTSTQYTVHQELSFRMPRHEDTKTLDIPYFHLFGKFDEEELKELVPVLLRSIAEDIATGDISADKKTMQKVVQLNKAVAVLDSETLEKIFLEVALKARSDRATEHQKIVRKLYIDLIGAAGTTQSALLAKKLFEQDLVTAWEAKEMFEAIPQNLYIVDVKVIEAYLNLFLSQKVQEQRNIASTVGITLGKLIKEAFVKQSQTPSDIHDRENVEKQRRAQHLINNNQNIVPTTHNTNQQQQQVYNSRIRRSAPWEKQFNHELIEKEQITKVIEILRKSLKECDTFYQKVALIETLAHMGVPEVLEVLAPYVNDQAPIEELPGYPVEDEKKIYEERNFIRQIVIYALSHVSQNYPQQVLALLVPVYENTVEPYEVRIAAFTIMLHSQPGKHVLERIASQLNTENNRQVKSFVYSALDTASNFTHPELKKLAENARLAIQLASTEEYGLEYSKMVGHNYYDEEKKYGINLIGDWVASNVSRVPRAAYFSLRQTDGPFQDVMLELGYNAKGIETLVDRVLEPNGILSDAFEAMTTKPKDRRIMKRSADSAKQALQALKDKLNLVVRAEEEPKATVFVKTFDRTSYLSLDRHYLNQLIDSAEDSIKDLASSLTQGKSYHYVKLVMPSQFVKVVPSELGLPIAIVQRHPTILSVKISNAKLSFEKSEQGTLPSAVNMTIQMQPLILHSNFQFVYAVSPVDNMAIGTHVEKTTRFTLPIELNFNYQLEKRELSWSVVPKVSEEMFHHHTVAKTFISKVSIAGTPDQDWLDDTVEIKSRPVSYQYEKEYLQDIFGLGFRVQAKTENVHSTPFYQSETAMKHGYLAALVEMWRDDDLTPCEFHVQLESDQEKPVSGFDFTLGYKRVEQFDKIDIEELNEKYLNNFEDNYELNRNRQQKLWRHRRNVDDTITSEEIFNKIFGQNLEKKAIKKMATTLMQQTRPVWEAKWDDDKEPKDQIESVLPTFVAHDILFSCVARSSQPKLYAANVLLVKSFDERNYWLKVNAFTKKQGLETEDRQLCFGAVASYPTIPNEFYYEPTTTQDLKAKLMAKISYGLDCETGAQILINGIMDKTDEKVLKSEDFVQYDGQSPARNNQEWYYQQCQVDRAQGKPLSYACERAIIEDSYFNQLVLDIKYRNISPEFVNITRKLAFATKVAFYGQLENNDLDVDNEDDLIHITAQFSTRFVDVPLANLYIETPKENIHFEKIYYPFFRPTSALVSMSDEYTHLMTGYKTVEKCVVMENFVQTFDNVTVQLESSPCQYLVAKDCSAYEKFAIFARQVDTESKTKTITILVAGTEIKLLPPTTTTAQLVIDDQTVELTSEKRHIAPKNGITIYLQKTLSETTSPIVVVECEKDDLKVLFDGKNVKVLVGNQYYGNTCGLCGDNNRESDDEFVGPDNCIYQNAKDFVNSYALSGQHCEQTPISKGLKRCPKEIESGKYYSRFVKQIKDQKKQYQAYTLQAQANAEELAHIRQGQLERQISRQNGMPLSQAQKFTLNGASPQQQQLIQRLRTHAISHQNQICFSVKPVLACIEGVSRPVQLQSQVIGYHCLPNTSISAQRLAEQAQYQVLELFGRKQIDFTSELQIPVSCTAA